MSTRSFLVIIISLIALFGTIKSFVSPEYLLSQSRLSSDGGTRAKSAPPRLNDIVQESSEEHQNPSSTSCSSHDEHCIWWHHQSFLDIEFGDHHHRFYCRQNIQRTGVEIYFSPTFNSDFEVVIEKVGEGDKQKPIEDIIESLRIQRELSSYHYFTKISSVSLQDDTCYTLLEYCPSVSFHTIFKNKESDAVEEFGPFKQMILNSFPFYLAQLIDMMFILSDHEIFHGGLNFNNVRIMENGYLKLTGFENSFKPDLTKRKNINMTCPWPAPELRLFGSSSSASNWYSMGSFVYEIWTDRRFIPFELMSQDVLCPSLKQIISDLTCKDSHLRFLKTRHLRSMEYFRNIDWDKLRSGELPAPFSFVLND